MALLSVADFRGYVSTPLADARIAELLAAAEAEIIRRIGPLGTVTETHWGGGSYITLLRRASSVEEIVQDDYGTLTTLDEDDYELGDDLRTIRRLDLVGIPNPASAWIGQARVEYTAEDDTAIRKIIQLKLVQLEILFTPGVSMQSVGNWTVQFAPGKSYAEQKDEILAGLSPAWSWA